MLGVQKSQFGTRFSAVGKIKDENEREFILHMCGDIVYYDVLKEDEVSGRLVSLLDDTFF